MKRKLITATLLTIVTVTAIIGANAQTSSITIYSGRGQALVEPIIKQFERETSIKVNVRYGTDAALLAAIQEEGGRSPADLFWANTSGALGAAGKAKLLRLLPASLLAKKPAYVPDSGLWTPLSVRFRALAYNNKTIKVDELPTSVFDLPKLSKFKGRIGWTPTYSSFQDFIGAMIVLKGEAVTKQWLEDMKKLEPKSYAASNTAMMEGMKNNEIDVALTNHYYILRFVKSGASIGTHYFAPGDVGSLALVTGAGILNTSKNLVNTQKLLRYLLEPKAQGFFSGEVFEYPVLGSTILPTTLLPFDQMVARSPKIDIDRASEYLEPALKMLREVGLI